MAVGQYVQPADVRDIFTGTDICISDGRILRATQRANDWIENYTQRILISQTYSDEVILLVNRWGQVVVRVREWPITNVSALSVQLYGDLNSTPLDARYVDFTIPPERLFYYSGNLSINGSPGLMFNGGPYLSRFTRGVIHYTYTGGFNPIPGDVTLAGILMTQVYLMKDANPMGAINISVSAEGSSNSLGLQAKSLHQLDAEEILEKYVRREA